MPRKLAPKATLDDFEYEVVFTVSALEADPDAADLAPPVLDWLVDIEACRKAERAVFLTAARVDAQRAVANARLDASCEDFARTLNAELKGDRTSGRWLLFFPLTVSQFVRQALPKQVARVQAWFHPEAPKDAILDAHRAGLEPWAQKAADAIARRNVVGGQRGQGRIARAELAEGLTRERDALHAVLVQRAKDRKLPRDWPNSFFHVESREDDAPATQEAGAPPVAAPT